MTFQQSYGFLFLKQPHIRQGSDGTLTEFCYCEEVAGLILSQRPLAPLLSAPPALLFAFAADNLERPLVFACFASPPPSLPGGGSRGNNTNNRLRFSGRFFGLLQRGDCGFCASLRGRGKGCALQTYRFDLQPTTLFSFPLRFAVMLCRRDHSIVFPTSDKLSYRSNIVLFNICGPLGSYLVN